MKKVKKECTTGYELDETDNTCVPVTCAAEGACKEGYACVPSKKKKVCVRAPCQQYFCEAPEQPECVCTTEYSPVCFDGVTYGNKCEAGCNQTVVKKLELIRPGLVNGTCEDACSLDQVRSARIGYPFG